MSDTAASRRPMESVEDAEEWIKTIPFYDGTVVGPSTAAFVQTVVLVDIAKSLRVLAGRL